MLQVLFYEISDKKFKMLPELDHKVCVDVCAYYNGKNIFWEKRTDLGEPLIVT